jgi:hypothetical protein
MTEADKMYMTFGRDAKAAIVDEVGYPLPEPPRLIIWPFPSVLGLFKPVGKLPFNPDNHEEAFL